LEAGTLPGLNSFPRGRARGKDVSQKVIKGRKGFENCVFSVTNICWRLMLPA
jgi:hypothetical protein